VFCGDKSIIRANFMIDDSAPNLKAFIGRGIVFAAPHIALDTDFPRVNRWLDVAQTMISALPTSEAIQGTLHF